MPRYQRPKGTQDVLPTEQPYWAHVRARATRLAQLAGFERIDVPVFENTELFARGVGEGTDIVDKEMYSFTDRGDRELTLRPEFTAGIVRAYIENGLQVLPQPVKLYTLGPILRDEQPQAGRFRQHTQFNVELLGELDPAADLEVMVLAWDLLADLGLSGLRFQLNSTGCPKCRPAYVKRLREYYAEHSSGICDDCRRRLERSPLRVLDCKAESCQPIIRGAPPIADHLCDECAAHFAQLQEYLDLLGRDYEINHRLVRGLDYYTKTVFEVWAAGIGAQSAVCGGGRYDGLAELLGGPPTPGVGFGLGLERAIMVMQHYSIDPPTLPGPRVFVAHLGAKPRSRAVQLAEQLRQAGIGTWLSFGERGLKSQLREANKRAVRFVVILGADELAAGAATVRDMDTSEQASVELGKLEEWLAVRL
jgi:histidyl-tRNA synthetase